jgi:hypothetical protein
LKKLLGVAAALMIAPCPEFAGLLFFLCVFWDNLGDMTLRIYDDHQLMKSEQVRERSLSAKVERYCVRTLAMGSMAERKLRGMATLAWKRMIKAPYRNFAPTSNWVRQLLQAGQTVPVRAATDEE